MEQERNNSFRLKDIVLGGLNLGSKLCFLGLTAALTINSFNHMTEEKYGKAIPYRDCGEAAGVLVFSYLLAEATERYKPGRRNQEDSSRESAPSV